jgi:hypothetical protein
MSGGKWTARWLDELLDLKFESGPVAIPVEKYFTRLQTVADAHNAALAEKDVELVKALQALVEITECNDKLQRIISDLHAAKEEE